jgi:hypothetical protein
MTSKKSVFLKNQSGAALVIALIMMIVITLIALAASYTSIFEIKMSGNKRGKTNAFYCSDAGISAIQSFTGNFDRKNFTKVVIPNTSSMYDSPLSVTPNPCGGNSTADILFFLNQVTPPRGMGYTAVNLNYAYYQIQSTGCDTVNSGATSQIQEDVFRILPIQ